MKTQQTKQTNQGHYTQGFELEDKMGREIGNIMHTFEVDFIQIPEESNSWFNQPIGHYYGMRPQATRNNKPYGPWQPERFFNTLDERTQAIDKYIVDAKKRAKVNVNKK
jgi:hypothetical protein